MEKIEVDDYEPTDTAHIIDRRNEIMLEQGGVVTRMKFDSVEEMSIDAFKRFVVPTMGNSENSLTVVRDSAAGSYSFILGDGVTRYKVTEVGECSLKTVCEQLKAENDEGFDYKYNFPVPLIRDRQTADHRSITAAFPSELRNYKYLGQVYKIWIPPTWFRVTLRPNGSTNNCGMCVVRSWDPVLEETKLLRWPLGNVWDYGNVCTGKSYSEQRQDARDPSIADIILMHREWVLGFDANTDLAEWTLDTKDKISDLYESMCNSGEITRHEDSNGPNYTVSKVLDILSVKDAWQRLAYDNLTANAMVFTS